MSYAPQHSFFSIFHSFTITLSGFKGQQWLFSHLCDHYLLWRIGYRGIAVTIFVMGPVKSFLQLVCSNFKQFQLFILELHYRIF